MGPTVDVAEPGPTADLEKGRVICHVGACADVASNIMHHQVLLPLCRHIVAKEALCNVLWCCKKCCLMCLQPRPRWQPWFSVAYSFMQHHIGLMHHHSEGSYVHLWRTVKNN